MKLESINELLNYLNPNKKDLKLCYDAMQSLDSTMLRLKDYTFWNKLSYTRNLISKTESFELFVCCWEPGQASRLHDLNGQSGWIKVISGDLTFSTGSLEDGQPKLGKQEVLSEGEMYVHNKSKMYSIQNQTGKRAISLHLYSLPITYYKVLNGSGTDVQNLNFTYNSINGTIISNL